MSEFNIGLAKPDIREEDFEDVLNVLRSGMLIQGKKVQEFERLSAEWAWVPHHARGNPPRGAARA